MIDRSLTTSLLGFKERYEMNEWSLMGRGDILLLHTDGLSDHRTQDQHYFPGRLEQALREVKHLGAREIYEAIKKDMLAFGPPDRRHLARRHQAEVTGFRGGSSDPPVFTRLGRQPKTTAHSNA